MSPTHTSPMAAWARPASASRAPFPEVLSVAATLGFHTGTQVRSFSRSIGIVEDEEQETGDRFRERGRWEMTGTTFGLGAMWDFRDFLRVSGSFTWSGDLRANPVGQTEGGEARFELPTEFRIGASAMLTPVVAATLGFGRSNWTPAESGAGAAARGAVTTFGGGLEWSGMGLFGRSLPVRVGYRRAGLPFSIDASTPTESGFADRLRLEPPRNRRPGHRRLRLLVREGHPRHGLDLRVVLTIHVLLPGIELLVGAGARTDPAAAAADRLPVASGTPPSR